MKKDTLYSFLLLPILFGTVHVAAAKDGDITFIGNVTASTCSISVNGGPADTSIDLGTSYVKTFPSAGSMSTPTTFNIGLTNCTPAIAKVGITFDGVADNHDSTVFENVITDETASTGIGVRLYNNGTDTSGISPHGTSALYPVTDNAVTLPFTARMTSTADTVTAGLLQADTDFTISYQ
ncbi:fimbrial protein [Rahnella contaminans]|uniref:fimbrial protein n=1 Tax=Rahnella contaminans TaxID=2703882 RepID=UPI003C2F0464